MMNDTRCIYIFTTQLKTRVVFLFQSTVLLAALAHLSSLLAHLTARLISQITSYLGLLFLCKLGISALNRYKKMSNSHKCQNHHPSKNYYMSKSGHAKISKIYFPEHFGFYEMATKLKKYSGLDKM